MSKLTTAEEWHDKILELLTDWDHHHEGGSRDAELGVLRDIQRNALEAAIDKLIQLKMRGGSTMPGVLTCVDEIRPLIPKNPAPTAGTDEEGGGAQ